LTTGKNSISNSPSNRSLISHPSHNASAFAKATADGSDDVGGKIVL
jgi:hypothetical protein